MSDPRPSAPVDIKPRTRVVTDGIEATTSPRHAPRRRHGRRGLGQAADRHRVARGTRSRPATCASTGSRRARRRACTPAAATRCSSARSRVSDGISMGHEGMHFSLVSPRGHRRLGRDRHDGRAPRRLRAARRLRQVAARHADGRRPPRPRRASSSTPARSRRAGSSSRDGTEKDVTIIDSFEAVGACKAGKHERGGPQAHRVRHRARRGRLRRHVHREHHGVRRRGARHEPARLRRAARRPTAAATTSRTAPARPSSTCCASASRPATS